MALIPKNPSYHRLKQEIWFDEDDDYFHNLRQKVIGKSLGRSRSYKFHVRRKLRVKIPNVRRFLIRKTRVVKFAWNKVCKRLKESQSHFGDLFAGNYLFMQVTPTALKYGNGTNGGVKSHDFVKGQHDVLSLSRISVPRINAN